MNFNMNRFQSQGRLKYNFGKFKGPFHVPKKKCLCSLTIPCYKHFQLNKNLKGQEKLSQGNRESFARNSNYVFGERGIQIPKVTDACKRSTKDAPQYLNNYCKISREEAASQCLHSIDGGSGTSHSNIFLPGVTSTPWKFDTHSNLQKQPLSSTSPDNHEKKISKFGEFFSCLENLIEERIKIFGRNTIISEKISNRLQTINSSYKSKENTEIILVNKNQMGCLDSVCFSANEVSHSKMHDRTENPEIIFETKNQSKELDSREGGSTEYSIYLPNGFGNLPPIPGTEQELCFSSYNCVNTPMHSEKVSGNDVGRRENISPSNNLRFLDLRSSTTVRNIPCRNNEPHLETVTIRRHGTEGMKLDLFDAPYVENTTKHKEITNCIKKKERCSNFHPTKLRHSKIYKTKNSKHFPIFDTVPPINLPKYAETAGYSEYATIKCSNFDTNQQQSLATNSEIEINVESSSEKKALHNNIETNVRHLKWDNDPPYQLLENTSNKSIEIGKKQITSSSHDNEAETREILGTPESPYEQTKYCRKKSVSFIDIIEVNTTEIISNIKKDILEVPYFRYKPLDVFQKNKWE